MVHKWHIGYISPYLQCEGHRLSNWRGIVRGTKQTLPRKKGGFDYMKILLLHNNLAKEKKWGGGNVERPMLLFSTEAPPRGSH